VEFLHLGISCLLSDVLTFQLVAAVVDYSVVLALQMIVSMPEQNILLECNFFLFSFVA
jgi:hypothetical protein